MTESSPGSRPGPDPLFAEPRLAACYDTFDGERDDLTNYRAILAVRAPCSARIAR